jgi:hypothetical protein
MPTAAQAHHPKSKQIPSHLLPASAAQPPVRTFDPALVAEFTSRGITEQRAIALLANVKPGRDLIAQLEHAEQSVRNSKIEIRNPAAYIARLIELDTPVPDGFETQGQRKAREEREQRDRAQRAMREAEQQLEWDYQDYRASEIDRYIEANPAAFEAIKAAKWKEDRERFSFTTESMAVLSAKNEIGKQLPFLTFEEFLDRKKQGSDFSLKPVAVLPAADAAPTMPEAESAVTTPPTGDILPDPEPPVTEPEPATPQPMMIDLASEPSPPPNEIDGNAAVNLV